MPPVSQTIRIKVLFFGRLKEIAGHCEQSLDLPANTDMNIELLYAHYAADHPQLYQYRSSRRRLLQSGIRRVEHPSSMPAMKLPSCPLLAVAEVYPCPPPPTTSSR